MDAPSPIAPAATVLTVSEKALRRVLEIRSQEDDPTTLALWVEVAGSAGNAYYYDAGVSAAFNRATRAGKDRLEADWP